MAAKLTFRYDKIGDILYIDKVLPYEEQDSEMLEDEIAVRLNPDTDEVETIEIMWFTKRLEAGEAIEIPVSANLRLAETVPD
jgi:uncharacterized protein YuzE